MIRELAPQDILPLIVDYLRSVGLKKTAKQIDANYEHDDTPLQGRSLVKIINYYVKNHQNLYEQFVQEQVEEVEQSEEEELKEPIQIKKVKTTSEEIVSQGQTKRKFSQTETTYETKQEQKQKKFFQKVDDNLYHQLPEKLKDNSFEAKSKFGVGDEFGKLGNEKLKNTRGDSFKKEKGKLKNRQFQGAGTINTSAINSIQL